LSQISFALQRASVDSQHSLTHPQTPVYMQKSRRYLLYRPSYSQLCPKFRCHGNGGDREKMQLAAFNGPSPKTPPIGAKNLANISYTSRVIAYFVPNFVAMATRKGPGVKLNNTIRLAVAENHTLEPKITTVSYTQPKL